MHDAATGNQLATELGSVYDCSEPWAETPDKEILAQKKKKKVVCHRKKGESWRN